MYEEVQYIIITVYQRRKFFERKHIHSHKQRTEVYRAYFDDFITDEKIKSLLEHQFRE